MNAFIRALQPDLRLIVSSRTIYPRGSFSTQYGLPELLRDLEEDKNKDTRKEIKREIDNEQCKDIIPYKPPTFDPLIGINFSYPDQSLDDKEE